MRPAQRIRAHGYIPRVVETHTMYTGTIHKGGLHMALHTPRRIGMCSHTRPRTGPRVSCTSCTSPSPYLPPLPLSPPPPFLSPVLSFFFSLSPPHHQKARGA